MTDDQREQKTIEILKLRGWCEADLSILRRWWKFEATPPELRDPDAIQRAGFEVLALAGGSLYYRLGAPLPRPAWQVFDALEERSLGLQSALLTTRWKSQVSATAGAFSRHARQCILALA